METNRVVKKFEALSPLELYAILKLRSAVFVVEQQCIFLDMDDKDKYCLHVMFWRGEHLLAYTRLVPPGTAYAEPSIGRVVSAPQARLSGLGREIMKYSIEQVYLLYGKVPIRIGAQLYLKKFYESFGFKQVGEVYDEDGINHIHMLLA